MLKFIKSILSPRPRTKTIDPSKILFTTPSINDEIGEINLKVDASENCLITHEDDWRSIEFVHQNHKELIEHEMKSVADIHNFHKQSLGWNKLHVRRLIRDPLAPVCIKIDELLNVLPGSKLMSGISYSGYRGAVDQGFAISTLAGMKFYGQTTANTNIAKCICIDPCPKVQDSSGANFVAHLTKFAVQHSLYLVCWNNLLVCDPSVKDFSYFFKSVQNAR